MAYEYISDDFEAIIVCTPELSGSSNSGAVHLGLRYVPASEVDSRIVSFAIEAKP